MCGSSDTRVLNIYIFLRLGYYYAHSMRHLKHSYAAKWPRSSGAAFKNRGMSSSTRQRLIPQLFSQYSNIRISVGTDLECLWAFRNSRLLWLEHIPFSSTVLRAAGIPSSSRTLLEVSVARCCDVFYLIFSYFICIFSAVGDFLLSCPDKRLPYYSAVAAIFVSLSTKHRFSVATR